MLAPAPYISVLVALLTTISASADRQAEIRLFMKGDFVFRNHCVDCHGKTGRGDGPLAKDVTTKPRDFRAGVFKFRSTPMGFLPIDEDLRRTIRRGVAGTIMPSFDHLTDGEVAAVIAYIKKFSRRWKDPKLTAKPAPLPQTPAWWDDPEKSKPHVTAGRAAFATHCASCHGTTGKGDGPAAKGLTNLSGVPITPADLRGPHYRSGPEPEDMFRTIAMGLDGTPMIGHLETLGPDKTWELVAYIRSLPTPDSAHHR